MPRINCTFPDCDKYCMAKNTLLEHVISCTDPPHLPQGEVDFILSQNVEELNPAKLKCNCEVKNNFGKRRAFCAHLAKKHFDEDQLDWIFTNFVPQPKGEDLPTAEEFAMIKKRLQKAEENVSKNFFGPKHMPRPKHSMVKSKAAAGDSSEDEKPKRKLSKEKDASKNVSFNKPRAYEKNAAKSRTISHEEVEDDDAEDDYEYYDNDDDNVSRMSDRSDHTVLDKTNIPFSATKPDLKLPEKLKEKFIKKHNLLTKEYGERFMTLADFFNKFPNYPTMAYMDYLENKELECIEEIAMTAVDGEPDVDIDETIFQKEKAVKIAKAKKNIAEKKKA